jgi:hypothetical protein
MVKVRKISDNLQVVYRFVAVNGKPHPSFYGKESKFAKNLIEKYGLEFLLWVPLPNNTKINTLLWLSCKEGYSYLNAYIMDYKLNTTDLSPQIKNIQLEQEKVGEDVIIERKPQTLKEFLNLYK